jgi:hypothetical protein
MSTDSSDPDAHDPAQHEHSWVSDAELEAAMQMEETVFGRDLNGDAAKKLAKRLFAENAAAAAQSIIKTAIHGSTEKVRFDAAKYVLERALGPTSQQPPGDGDAPLEAAMNELMGNTKGRGSSHPG